MKRNINLIIVIAAIPLSIWGLGWFLWDWFALWEYLTSSMYQHLLLLGMGIAFSILAVLRKFLGQSKQLTNPEIHEPQKQKSNPTENEAIKKIGNEITEMNRKLGDFHAFLNIIKAKENPIKEVKKLREEVNGITRKLNDNELLSKIKSDQKEEEEATKVVAD